MKRVVFLLLVVISFVVYSCSKSNTSTCPTPAIGTISGTANINVGDSTKLSESVNGGSWTTSNTAIATIVGSTGSVTGIATGTAIITYTTTNGCAAATAIYPITISCPLPNAGVITGATNVDMGNTTTLVESLSGGNWSSSNTAIATVGSNGVVTGVAAGSAVITYTTTNLCGNATVTYSITVNTTHIGTSYGGGIIAYILQPGDPGYSSTVQHGLIAAPTDQSTGIVWWNGSYITTGATGTAIGTGLANTNAIIAAQGAGSYAATLCRNLTLGGYNDWYLPSKDELNILYINKNIISGFNAAYYWSSSEYDGYYAWEQYFIFGNQNYDNKSNVNSVRAVRAF